MWRKSAEVKVPVPVTAVLAPESAKPQGMSRAPGTPSAAETIASGSSRISRGLEIHGEFSGNSDLYIDGEAQGKIRLADARLTIGPHGHVQADIEAREIIVEGSVQGSLKARERVHLGAASRVQGTVLTPRIGIDDGAEFHGKVDMKRPSASTAPSAAIAAADAEAPQAVSTRTPGE